MLILKFLWKTIKQIRKARKIIKIKEYEGRLALWDMKIYYKATIMKSIRINHGTKLKIQNQTHMLMEMWLMIR